MWWKKLLPGLTTLVILAGFGIFHRLAGVLLALPALDLAPRLVKMVAPIFSRSD
jgi:hypothetical protein